VTLILVGVFRFIVGPSALPIIALSGLFLIALGIVISYLPPLLDVYTSIHVEETITIHAPIEKVFELNSNYANWSSINPQIRAVHLISQQNNERVIEHENANGIKYREIHRIFSNRTEEQADEKKWRTKEVWTFEPFADGTRITVVVDLSLLGIHIKPIVTSRTRRNVQSALLSLKKIAETTS